MKNERARRLPFSTLLAVALMIAFALSLLPILAAARYDAPDSDDLLYGQEAQAAFAESGSFGALLAAAAEKTAQHHQIAHGRFVNTFFGAAYLGAAGLAHYWSVPLLLLTAFIAAFLFFTYVLLVRTVGTGKSAWLALSFTALLLYVQLMPSPAEGFFWLCGGLGYTLHCAAVMTMLALVLLGLQAEKRGARIACGLLGALCAFLAAGLGFSLILATGGLLLGGVVLCVFKKRKQFLPWLLAILAVFAACAIIQLTAPAVSVRAEWEQAMYGYQPMGAVQAVAASFAYAVGTLLYRLDAGMLVFLALTVALCARALDHSACRFRLPGLVTAASFCLYATLFTASLYATSTMGPYRQRNLVYLMEFFFWGVNAAYWTGWFERRLQKLPGADAWPDRIAQASRAIVKYRLALLCTIGVLLLAAATARDIHEATSLSALRELTNGSARSRYETRMAEIAAGLGDDPGERAKSRLYIY